MAAGVSKKRSKKNTEPKQLVSVELNLTFSVEILPSELHEKIQSSMGKPMTLSDFISTLVDNPNKFGIHEFSIDNNIQNHFGVYQAIGVPVITIKAHEIR